MNKEQYDKLFDLIGQGFFKPSGDCPTPQDVEDPAVERLAFGRELRASGFPEPPSCFVFEAMLDGIWLMLIHRFAYRLVQCGDVRFGRTVEEILDHIHSDEALLKSFIGRWVRPAYVYMLAHMPEKITLAFDALADESVIVGAQDGNGQRWDYAAEPKKGAAKGKPTTVAGIPSRHAKELVTREVAAIRRRIEEFEPVVGRKAREPKLTDQKLLNIALDPSKTFDAPTVATELGVSKSYVNKVVRKRFGGFRTLRRGLRADSEESESEGDAAAPETRSLTTSPTEADVASDVYHLFDERCEPPDLSHLPVPPVLEPGDDPLRLFPAPDEYQRLLDEIERDNGLTGEAGG